MPLNHTDSDDVPFATLAVPNIANSKKSKKSTKAAATAPAAAATAAAPGKKQQQPSPNTVMRIKNGALKAALAVGKVQARNHNDAVHDALQQQRGNRLMHHLRTVSVRRNFFTGATHALANMISGAYGSPHSKASNNNSDADCDADAPATTQAMPSRTVRYSLLSRSRSDANSTAAPGFGKKKGGCPKDHRADVFFMIKELRFISIFFTARGTSTILLHVTHMMHGAHEVLTEAIRSELVPPNTELPLINCVALPDTHAVWPQIHTSAISLFFRVLAPFIVNDRTAFLHHVDDKLSGLPITARDDVAYNTVVSFLWPRALTPMPMRLYGTYAGTRELDMTTAQRAGLVDDEIFVIFIAVARANIGSAYDTPGIMFDDDIIAAVPAKYVRMMTSDQDGAP